MNIFMNFKDELNQFKVLAKEYPFIISDYLIKEFTETTKTIDEYGK